MAEKQWEGKSYGTPLGYRIFIFFFKYLGLRFAYLNLTYVVLFFVIKCRKERKAIWFYYRQIHKYSVLKSSLKIYSHFFVFAQTIVDKVAIRYGFSDKFKYTFENAEEAIELMSKPQEAIFLGAHIGSWEVGSHIFSKYDKTMNILMVDAEYQRIKNVIEKSGENPGYKIIPINEDSIEAILRVKKALADGEILGIQGDRYIDEKRKKEVDFLGRKADFPEGPFLMASLEWGAIAFSEFKASVSILIFCFDHLSIDVSPLCLLCYCQLLLLCLFRFTLFRCSYMGCMGLPRWCIGKESACQCRRLRRLGFDPCIRKMLWSRKWQPTPIFLPEKCHGQESLEGYNPWARKELDMTE